MKIEVNKISVLIQAIAEVQQNAGRIIPGTSDFLKGLPFRTDYDLSKCIKLLNKKMAEIATDFSAFTQPKGIVYTEEQVGNNILAKWKLPEDATDDFKKEFGDLYNKAWNEAIELDIKTYHATEFEGIIFKDCLTKNIFFEYMLTD